MNDQPAVCALAGSASDSEGATSAATNAKAQSALKVVIRRDLNFIAVTRLKWEDFETPTLIVCQLEESTVLKQSSARHQVG